MTFPDLAVSRRDVLRAGALAALPIPGALRWLPAGDDRCVVVLELEGGNDGLNTLIPLDDPAYVAARPGLGEVRARALPLGGGYGLHAALRPVLGAFAGLGTVVHGVGYPNPDRSHFRSRDIWHAADPALGRVGADATGWLGRAADWLAERGAAVPGVSVGSLSVPLLLKSRSVVVPSLQSLSDYRIVVDPAGGLGEERRARLLEVATHTAPASDLERFVRDVAGSAVASAERLREELARYRPRAEYPDGDLGRRLQLLGQIVVSGFGSRLFHVGYGGFDTHARQLPAHEGLLRQLALAVAALLEDLRAHGALPRTTIVVHSEFGRRVAENRSLGTDHGAAGPVFLFGGGLAPGPLGRPPSLTELCDGDLAPSCDFRELYAAVLRRLRIDEAAVLGARFRGIEPFS